MVFIPSNVPPEDNQLDSSDAFTADTPFDIKQAAITHRRHRWYQPQLIGTPTGPYSVTPGLAAGAFQRIQFDHKPDWIVVSISGQTAQTGRCYVFMGEEGGNPVMLGPHGKLSMPASQSGIVVIRNIGTTATYGVVIAHAGYVESVGVDVECGD